MGNNIPMYSLEEHKKKILSDLQDFLNYKRTNSLDFGSRLLKPFVVESCSSGRKDENIMVKFKGYDELPHANHYWVNKKELDEFLNGKKELGVALMIDHAYEDGEQIIFEINLIKNGIKKPHLVDAQKIRGLNIKHNGRIFKCYDVNVSINEDFSIDKAVRAYVLESSSAESYINRNTVRQNKVEIKNGITFEDFDTQEEFVRKFEALEAIRLERKDVVNELRAWVVLNMTDKVEKSVLNSFLKKLSEIV